MRWLKRATRPVPVETPTGVAFRWPSSKSFAGGGWRHPGKPPVDLGKAIREKVAPLIKRDLQKSIADQLRQALRR